MLTADRLRDVLEYDPETGVFRWRVSRRCVKVGDIAGSLSKTDGYRRIAIDGRSYKANRLAFLYMTDKFPSAEVDHINGCRNDDRWCNLREASRSENARNSRRRRDNTSGFKGVSWCRQRSKWKVYVSFNGRRIHLGFYADIADAAAAYAAGSERYHGEFGRV